jgi:hypothetical protein
MRAPFLLKITGMLLVGGVFICLCAPSGAMPEFFFTCKVFLVEELGTQAQRDGLIDEVTLRAAERDGTMQDYETTVAFCNAVEAQRRLARINEKMADFAIELAASERDERQQSGR